MILDKNELANGHFIKQGMEDLGPQPAEPPRVSRNGFDNSLEGKLASRRKEPLRHPQCEHQEPWKEIESVLPDNHRHRGVWEGTGSGCPEINKAASRNSLGIEASKHRGRQGRESSKDSNWQATSTL